MLERKRTLIGVLLLVVGIVALAAWENGGRGRLLYDEVLEVKKDVPRGTLVESGMIRTVREESPPKDALRPKDRSRIVGSYAAQALYRGRALYAAEFTRKGLVTGSGTGRSVVKIPESWIASFPSDLQPGDRAVLWSGGEKVTEAYVHAVDLEKGTVEIAATEKQTAEIGRKAAEGARFLISGA